jgi:hypothetical protein
VGDQATRILARRLTVLGLALLLGCVCLVPLAVGSRGLPRLLATSVHGHRYVWQIRPAEIVYTGDGSGVLGGFDGTGAAHPGHLKWSTWTRKQATGSGAVWLDNCIPYCSSGTFKAYAVSVRAFRTVKGRFTRLTLRFSYQGKRTVDRRGIWRVGGSWSYYLLPK